MNKKYFKVTIFILFFVFQFNATNAQAVQSETVYFVVDQMPEYPGGELELQKHIMSNFKYPKSCCQDGIKGKLYVRFAVMPDGHVDSVRVVRPVDPQLDAEAIRVVKTLAKWKAGKEKGVAVAVWYTIPFNDIGFGDE